MYKDTEIYSFNKTHNAHFYTSNNYVIVRLGISTNLFIGPQIQITTERTS